MLEYYGDNRRNPLQHLFSVRLTLAVSENELCKQCACARLGPAAEAPFIYRIGNSGDANRAYGGATMRFFRHAEGSGPDGTESV